jgi:hypothetical protein
MDQQATVLDAMRWGRSALDRDSRAVLSFKKDTPSSLNGGESIVRLGRGVPKPDLPLLFGSSSPEIEAQNNLAPLAAFVSHRN